MVALFGGHRLEDSAMEATARSFADSEAYRHRQFDGWQVWTAPETDHGMTGFSIRTANGLAFVYGDRLWPPVSEPGSGDLAAWCAESMVTFAGALCSHDQVDLWTDPISACPLYYALAPDGRLAFAAEAKALLLLLPHLRDLAWMNYGLSDILPNGRPAFPGIVAVEPGCNVRFCRSKEGWCVAEVHANVQPQPHPSITSLDVASDRVRAELGYAVTRALGGEHRVGVTLSGGVDSSAVVALARADLADVHTYTIGTPYGDEFEFARSVAQHFGLAHHAECMDPDDLDRLLPLLVWTMETWDPLTLQIAAPTAFLYTRLNDTDPRTFLSGYGADLLFGGTLSASLTEAQVEARVSQQIARASVTNELSPAIPIRCRVAVRNPYLTPRMVSTALAIRGRLKVRDGHVKYVLRHALMGDLPPRVAWRPKQGIHEGAQMAGMFRAVFGTTDPVEQERQLRRLAESMFLDVSGVAASATKRLGSQCASS